MDIVKKTESGKVGVGGWSCQCCGADRKTRKLTRRSVRRAMKQELRRGEA